MGNQNFKLKGQGIIKWAYLIKVNATALYLLPDELPGNVLHDIPKCLEFYYLRAISAEQFREMTRVWIQKNSSEFEFKSIEDILDEYNRLYRDIIPGDRYMIHYQPNEELGLYYNGQKQGSVAADPLFVRLLFSIWFGEQPVAVSLKESIINP